jgi:hypothetical protein
MRRKIVLIWFVLVAGVGNAQAPIIECPVNAKALFEVVIDIFQSYDSLGKVKLQSVLAGATPHFAEPEFFIHPETKEKCSPFPVVFENDTLYIIDSFVYCLDSNGEWAYDAVRSTKQFLSQDNILSLKIYIRNETDKSIDLSKIELLQNLKMPLRTLEITFFLHEPKKTKLNIRKWEFIKDSEAFYTINLDVPINEKKKHVLRSLNRFEQLEKIEIRGVF